MAQSRFDRLNASLRTSGLDAVILNPGPTLTHLTGLRFHLMERPVVLLLRRIRTRPLYCPNWNYRRSPRCLITFMSFLILRTRLSGITPFAKLCRRSAWMGSGSELSRAVASAGVPPCQSGRARSGLSRCERMCYPVCDCGKKSRSGRHAPCGKDRAGRARSDDPVDKNWHDRKRSFFRTGGAVAQTWLGA